MTRLETMTSFQGNTKQVNHTVLCIGELLCKRTEKFLRMSIVANRCTLCADIYFILFYLLSY